MPFVAWIAVAQQSSTVSPQTQAAPSAPDDLAQEMQFSDQPHFSVAGVTDWTAAGGHGSDATLRASESLASATATLTPAPGEAHPSAADAARETRLRSALLQTPEGFAENEQLGELLLEQGRFTDAMPLLETAHRLDPASETSLEDLARAEAGTGKLAQARERITSSLAQHPGAPLLRLAAQLDEQLGDPLKAVREFEQAATLDPSEQNEFDWASELLSHRAIWQAEAVFRKGASAYPTSVRMQTGLGAALFAGARYDDAATQLCKASDLAPEDPHPYLFLGQVELAAPNALPCVEAKLARFLQMQPRSATAHYLYAMAILKAAARSESAKQVEQLLHEAVSLDGHCSEAYLELGNLAAERRDTPAAIDFYNKAIAAAPQLADAHYRLGVAYDRSGRTADAAREFALHDQLQQQQAAAVEAQRKAVKQFLFAGQAEPPLKPIEP
jgi:tetratricopeptide (TPR) repeat protein